MCRVGSDADGPGREHWTAMLGNPRKPIEHWHQLVEVMCTWSRVRQRDFDMCATSCRMLTSALVPAAGVASRRVSMKLAERQEVMHSTGRRNFGRRLMRRRFRTEQKGETRSFKLKTKPGICSLVGFSGISLIKIKCLVRIQENISQTGQFSK